LEDPVNKRLLPVLALALASMATSVSAQGPHDAGAFQFRLGGYFPSMGGAFWGENFDRYTLDESDFTDAMIGGSYIASLSNYLELGLNVDFYDAAARSAERDFTDEDGYAILHDTAMRVIPMTVDLRVLPAGRYAMRGSGGRIAVRRPVPYLGAGLGFNYWEFEEVGDFVDDPNALFPMVVSDRLADSGTEFEMHVLGGVEIPVSPAWSLNFEGRYSWSEADPDADLASIYPGEIDLGGASFFFGASVRF
jgi:opacity protein-like surface antigen